MRPQGMRWVRPTSVLLGLAALSMFVVALPPVVAWISLGLSVVSTELRCWRARRVERAYRRFVSNELSRLIMYIERNELPSSILEDAIKFVESNGEG